MADDILVAENMLSRYNMRKFVRIIKLNETSKGVARKSVPEHQRKFTTELSPCPL